MTPREQKLFDALNNIAYDSTLCSGGRGSYSFDYYMTDCNDIQAARDLIREIEKEETRETEIAAAEAAGDTIRDNETEKAR